MKILRYMIKEKFNLHIGTKSSLTLSVSSKGMQTSITFVSDDLDHDEIAVLVFMNHLFILVKERFNVDVIDVFSDGAPSQFKNQYIFNALTYFHSKCI